MKYIVKLICVISLLCMYSCEYEAEIAYKISNKTTNKIMVIYNDNDFKNKNDTVFVASNETGLIVVHGQGLSSVEYYKETKDRLSEFSQLDIYKNDTIKSKTDFMLTSKWIWHKNNAHSADYTATINDSDF